MPARLRTSALLGLLLSLSVRAQEGSLPAVVVENALDESLGVAESASQGRVSGPQLQNRPRPRNGDLLEAVPGVVVTQHSSDGKANQYFARGFNLDHGTDFRTSVLGMPVNMPTHAHGQGYSDLNFLIPELVSSIRYKKGNYYAEEGDFSSAGSAAFDYVRSMERGLLSLEAGGHRYRRLVLADSTKLTRGELLVALEAVGNDGPWDVPEGYRRYNGVLSWNLKRGNEELRLAAMAFQSSWTATDQIPRRAVSTGLTGRFGSLDASDGGATARHSLSADFTRRHANGALRANAYLVRSRLDLFSSFTFFQDDPVNGDQFNQSERRLLAGLNVERAWLHSLGRRPSETTVGVQGRQDRLSPVALYSTRQRQRLATTREDRVHESALGVFVSNATHWMPRLRTVAGLRHDAFHFRVDSSNAADSGSRSAGITSPKLSAIFMPRAGSELYLNWGQGFHSNDARGVTAAVNPSTPLVKSRGHEIGLRQANWLPGLSSTLAVWQLDLDSELVFVGDAGSTQASRPSRRHGLELANAWQPRPGIRLDLDLAWSRSRFSDADPAGPYIPGAVDRIASLGLILEQGRSLASLRLRHVGGRALVEDNSVRSSSSTLLNAKFGYALTPQAKLTLEAINLFNRAASDIDYFYASRLRSDPPGVSVSDIHSHPAEPRSFRLGLQLRY